MRNIKKKSQTSIEISLERTNFKVSSLGDKRSDDDTHILYNIFLL